MPERWKMFVNGEWVNSSNGKTVEILNPDNGEVYSVVPAAAIEDVREAIDAAYDVKSQWSGMMPQERAEILFNASRMIKEEADEVAKILVMESGSTIRKAMYEVQKTGDYVRARGEEIFRIRGETYPSLTEEKFSMSIRQPKGVVAAISPWNFPLILAMEKVASALACGNSVVLKPSSDTPCTLLKMAEIFERCKTPKGVFNVIVGLGSSIGDELVTNPKVNYINFTGSTKVGRHIAELAGKHLKKVTLELGGKNPLIVLKDADLDVASSAACYGGFFHSGQICIAVGRVIVEKEVAGEFTEKLVAKAEKITVKKGALFDPSTILSPLINSDQCETVKRHVADALAKGAQLLAGGRSHGLYHEATVLRNITPDMMIYDQETFGPVIPIIEVSSVEGAIKTANDTVYGLSSGIFTNDISKAMKIAECLETGMVHINDSSFYADQECAPLGGVKASGLGRVGTHYSIEEGTDLKWITIQKEPRDYQV